MGTWKIHDKKGSGNFLIPSSSVKIFAVPKSVICMCMLSPNKIFSGFKSLEKKMVFNSVTSLNNGLTD